MSLQLVPRDDRYMGPAYWLEIQDTAPQDLATVGFTVVASAMGAVLRKAFREHRASCSACLERPRWVYSCDEGKRLYELQPWGDTIALA
jgi:hypothetical protein